MIQLLHKFEDLENRPLKLDGNHPNTFKSWHNLIELYEAWNKPEKAEEWRANLLKVEDISKRDCT